MRYAVKVVSAVCEWPQALSHEDPTAMQHPLVRLRVGVLAVKQPSPARGLLSESGRSRATVGRSAASFRSQEVSSLQTCKGVSKILLLTTTAIKSMHQGR